MFIVPASDDTRKPQLERLIRIYSTDILRICYVYLTDHALAEDAMQDTFLKVWKYLRKREPPDIVSERAWLIRIAINTCKDYKRSAWLQRVDLKASVYELPDSIAAASPEDRDILLDVMRLPEPCKAVVLLHHFQGFNRSETARILHISRSAVGKRLNKAYALLQITRNGGETHV